MIYHNLTTAQVSLGHVSISYYDSGEQTGESPPVLFLHGSYDTKECWESYFKPLESDGHRVIAWDQRALGDSSVTSGPYTIEMLLDDLESFIESPQLVLNDGPIVIVGHSLGGLLGLMLSLKAPQHIASLILIGSSAAFRPLFRGQMTPEYISEHMDEFLDKVSPYFFRPDQPDIKAETLGRWMDVPFDVYKKYVAGIRHPDIRRQLSRITCPCLLIYGEEDKLTTIDLDGAELKQGLSQCSMEVIPAAGHYVHLEKPDEVIATIKKYLSHPNS